jgi:hypothetical protein
MLEMPLARRDRLTDTGFAEANAGCELIGVRKKFEGGSWRELEAGHDGLN